MLKKFVSALMTAALLVSYIPAAPLYADPPGIVAAADTFINSSATNAVYGDSDYIAVSSIEATQGTLPEDCPDPEQVIRNAKDAVVMESYLKFNVPATPQWKTVKSAKLKLTFSKKISVTEDTYLSVYQTANTDWIESGAGALTWANRAGYLPGVEQISGIAFKEVSANQSVEIDIKDAIAGAGTYSFVLETETNRIIQIHSKEATTESYRPTLSIEYEDVPYIGPVEDTFVNQANPDTAQGFQTFFNVTSSSTAQKDAYLKFDLTGMTDRRAIKKATLLLTATSTNGTAGEVTYLSLHNVGDNSWTEAGLTWNSRGSAIPDDNPISVASIVNGVPSNDQLIELDVTDAIAESKVYSFAVKTTSGAIQKIASRDIPAAGKAPRLYIEYAVPDAISYDVSAKADTFVNEASAVTAPGDQPYMNVRNAASNGNAAYVMFNVDRLSGGKVVRSATLSLTALTTGGTSGTEAMSVHPVASNIWKEDNLSWNSREQWLPGEDLVHYMPSPDNTIATAPILTGQSTEQTINLDVTSAVTESGTYTFAIRTTADSVVQLATRETECSGVSGCKAPVLHITYMDSPETATEMLKAFYPANPLVKDSAEDAYVQAALPDANSDMNGETTLIVQKGADSSRKAAYFKFRFNKDDFSLDQIRRVTLHVFGKTVDATEHTIEARRLSNDWDEDSVTYTLLNPYTGDNGLISFAKFDGSGAVVHQQFDITGYAKERLAADSGEVSLQLQGTIGKAVQIYSKDSPTEEYRPYLEIERYANNKAQSPTYTLFDKDAQRNLVQEDLIPQLPNTADTSSTPVVINLEENANYRFTTASNNRGSSTPFLQLQSPLNSSGLPIVRKDVTINCNGSTLWFDDYRPGLVFRFNGSVEVNGCHLEYDQLPYTQGVVLNVDAEGKYFEFELDPGFRTLDNLQNYNGEQLGVRTFFYDNDNAYGADYQKMETNNFEMKYQVKLRKNVYRVYTKAPAGQDYDLTDMKLHTGDSVVLKLREGGNQAIKAEGNTSMEFNDVHIYSSPFLAAAIQNTTGNVSFLDSSIETRPATKRLLSSSADGFNVRNAGGELRVEDSTFSGTGDDMLVIHSLFQGVVDVPTDANGYYYFRGNKDTFNLMYPVGSVLRFYDMNDQFELLGSATVKEAVYLDSSNPLFAEEAAAIHTKYFQDNVCPRREQLPAVTIPGKEKIDSKFWEDMAKAYYKIKLENFSTGFAYDDIEPLMLVDVDNLKSSKAIVTGSTFTNSNNHAMFLNSKELQISGNTVTWMRRNAIATDVDLEIGIMGGGPVTSGNIYDNTFQDINIGLNMVPRSNFMPGAIAMALIRKDLVWNQVYDPEFNTLPDVPSKIVFSNNTANNSPFKNVNIYDNSFSRLGGFAVFLMNAYNFDIHDNTISNACMLNRNEESAQWSLYPNSTTNTANPTPLAYPNRAFYVDASGNITFTNNTIVNPGDYCKSNPTDSTDEALIVGPQAAGIHYTPSP